MAEDEVLMGYIDVNRPRFLRLCYSASVEPHDRYNIGTLREKTLHRVLKDYFTGPGMRQETPVGDYIADIAGEGRIIEIQTSALSPMKEKLEAFLPLAEVTIVFPIAERKWISWIHPATGRISEKKRSPVTGRPTDVLAEMIYIRRYLNHPHLTIRTVQVETEEYRLLSPTGGRPRRRAQVQYERMPVDLFSAYDFSSPADYAAWLPFAPAAEVTAAEVLRALHFRGGSMGRSAVIGVLCEVGVLEKLGRRGRSFLYRVAAGAPEEG